MEQVNKKLLLVLKSTGSSLYPRIHSKLRNIASRCMSSWEDSDDDIRGGFRRRNTSNDYDEDDFAERPSFNSNRSRNFNNFDRDRPRFQNSFNNRGRDMFQSAGEQLRRPQWESIQLKPFEKNFYTPSETVLNRSAEEIAEFRKKNNLSLLGDDIPNPILEFSDYEFPKEATHIFSQKGFEKPTPIQSQGWPIALSGKDFVGIGQTGSGKTLGFAVPGLVHIKHQPTVEGGEGPIGLVLGPTRELVQQINEVSNPMFASSGLRTACLFGGASKSIQARSLYDRPSLCIATPGRLLDFLESGITDLKRCTYLVLDEADRMLDMGFEPQIRKIISQIRPNRQTLMWSATWPKEVEELATDFLNDFVRLNVGSLELYANPNIKQEFEICDMFDKKNRFMEKMAELTQSHKKVLIFSQTKVMVDNISRMLQRSGIKSRGIHGDHSQNARDSTLDGFRSGRFTALVATDVASRGLDVDDITLVVNFDFPGQIEDYVHRIGRTGRAGKTGKALSFLTSENSSLVRDLIKLLQKANQEIPSELSDLSNSTNSFRSNKNFGGRGFGKARGKSW